MGSRRASKRCRILPTGVGTVILLCFTKFEKYNYLGSLTTLPQNYNIPILTLLWMRPIGLTNRTFKLTFFKCLEKI